MAEDTVGITPVTGYNLIAPIEEKAGNFILSDNIKSKPQRGKIIKTTGMAPSEMVANLFVSCPAKVGDIVLYRNYGTELCNVDGVDYVLVKHSDIVAILDK